MKKATGIRKRIRAHAMKRRLFNILSALSLLLFVATGLLWVRSYWHFDKIAYTVIVRGKTGYSQYNAASYPGFIDVTHTDVAGPLPTYTRLWRAPAGFTYTSERLSTPRWNPRDQGTTIKVYLLLHIPYWLLLLAASILPATWLAKARNQRRLAKQGHCMKCGYDLRASKDRCPECGTAIPAPVPASGDPAHG